MSHGVTYYKSKSMCIYCGESDVKLTNEHIVPYALGGCHVIREASCEKCADITKLFEQRVARDIWGDARIAFDAPSRRKKQRKSYIWMSDPDDIRKRRKVPSSEYPGALIFYKMRRAGLLEGLPETVDISNRWQLVAITDDKRTKDFEAKYPGKLTVRFRNFPFEFGQLLAKIGYGQVLTTLDPGDFRRVCLPYIMGTRKNVSYIVGGSFEDVKPEPDHGYNLSTVGFGNHQSIMLVALIRLYANTHSPQYHVVVGDVVGAEKVSRVAAKLAASGTEFFVVDVPHVRGEKQEHWLPSVFPLPFWSA